MFEEPTVLIVGAGGSNPYSFPLGDGLIAGISDTLRDSGVFGECLSQLGFTREDKDRFRDVLKHSDMDTIDQFLRNKSAFLNIGKATIALALIKHESLHSLYPGDKSIDDHWYKKLKELLGDSKEEVRNNKLTIITFNYDRSLEHYLYTALSNKFDWSDNEAAETVNKIPFIHVHGSLGALPWQHSDDNSRPFENTIDTAHVRRAISSLKTISETSDQDAEYQAARMAINHSRHIFMIGCGYHHDNLQRLGLTNRRVQVIGTAVGIPDFKRTNLRRSNPWLTLSDSQSTTLFMETTKGFRIASGQQKPDGPMPAPMISGKIW